MHGVPRQGVMVQAFGVSLQRRCRNSTAANEHDDGEDDDEHGQQHDEGQRAEDEAQRDGFPAKLLQVETDGRTALLAALHKKVLLAEPDEQGAQGLTEGPQEGGLHPAELPDAVEIAGDETRFGVVGGGGLLKRGRLSSLRFRDRVHRFGCFPINYNEHRSRILDKNSPNFSCPGHAMSRPCTRHRGRR